MKNPRIAHTRLWLKSPMYRLSWFSWPTALALAATVAIWGVPPDDQGTSSAPWAATDQPGPSPIDHPALEKPTEKYVTGHSLLEVFFENNFNVGEISIPLPSGKWVVINAGTYKKDGWSGAIYNLMNVEGRNIKKAIHIIAGDYMLESPPGLSLDPHCSQNNIDNIAFENISCESNGMQIFWHIGNYWTVSWNQYSTANNHLDKFDVDLAKTVTARSYEYPQTFLYYKFNYITKSHFITTTYYIAVPFEHTLKFMTNYRDSDWHNLNIGNDPNKLKFVEQLKTEAQVLWPLFLQSSKSAMK